MRGSLRLFRFAGIDIKLHFTFPLILVLGAVQWGGEHGARGALFGVLLMLALFTCVVLHELGHSLVAQRFGIPVREIVLLPIGGVALLSRMPRKPVQELLIAIAGPLVNVVLAIGLYFLIGLGGFSVDPRTLIDEAQKAAPSTSTFLHWLLAANVSLVLFNLIPAFPMDGGRILRALLAMFIGFRRATRIASGVGQLIAVGLGLYGLSTGNFLLSVLAVFVFFSAGQERAVENARVLLSTLRLRDGYNKHALTLAPGDSVSRVIDYLLTSYQPDFAVVMSGRLLGVVTRDAALAALATQEGDPYVAGIMQREVFPLVAALTLAEAQEKMAEAGVTHAAVFEDGERYLGLVNSDDLREALHIATFVHLAEARRGRLAGGDPA